MIGETLAHYRILEKIGEGGMGEVYVAEDTKLKRQVALKLLPEAMAADSERLQRFQREAEAIAALNHPNIVTIFSVEEDKGHHFLTMELVQGVDLSNKIPAQGMNLEQIFAVAIPVAEALAAAHEQGVVHRDLKPANIMVGDGDRVKILDFGLAKLAARMVGEGSTTQMATDSITQEGRILGTVSYMSPEQAEGKPIDGRSDIFSLGVVLYQMATGEQPFKGDTNLSTLSSILKDDPDSVTDLRTNLPRHLGRIITHCLEKDPKRRYQSAQDVVNELTALEGEIASGKTPSETSLPAMEAPTSRPAWLPFAIGAGLLLAAIIGWLALKGDESEAPESSAAESQASDTGTAPSASDGSEVAPAGTSDAVAVLPFTNFSGRSELDFLALAIPDEITTTLSYAQKLEVRPFSLTRKYQDPTTDPQAAGREVRAASLVTGQYTMEGEQLQVTLEAIDVEGNSLIWRHRLSVSGNDSLALREAVASKVRQELVPALGGTTEEAAIAAPTNREAYRKYLESLAISRDPEPNLRGIEVLEEVVELDPEFAAAWAALSDRYGYDGYYGGGTAAERIAAFNRSEAAARRALELDPNNLEAAQNLTFRAIEDGRMGEAYQTARLALTQNPDLASPHFIMSYVYRYAGLLDDAARECELAIAINPTDFSMRSCAITFYRLGDFERARDFLALDPASTWARTHEATLEYFAGNLDFDPQPQLLADCRADPESETTRTSLERRINFIETVPDPEQAYHTLAVIALCGFHDEALRLLPVVANAGYCAPGVFEEGPFRALEGKPGWEEAQAAHDACHAEFLGAKRRVDAGMPPG